MKNNELKRCCELLLQNGLTIAFAESVTAEKPVGTRLIHINMAGETLVSERTLFSGSPEEIIMQTISIRPGS